MATAVYKRASRAAPNKFSGFAEPMASWDSRRYRSGCGPAPLIRVRLLPVRRSSCRPRLVSRGSAKADLFVVIAYGKRALLPRLRLGCDRPA